MRKGKIVILTNNNTEADKCVNFLLGNFKNINQKSYGMRFIRINGYNIHIVNINCWGEAKACVPEIIYVYRNSVRYLESDMCVIYKDIEVRTKMCSERKEPIRFITDFSEIDLKELEDDNYAMMNKIKNNNIRSKSASTIYIDDEYFKSME